MKKSIAIGEFKAKCLRLLEEVRTKKDIITITKRGQPIAEVIPFPEGKNNAREELRGTLVFENDIVSPLNEDWEVLR